MTTLETLYHTRDALAVLSGERPEWQFTDWTRCTCGHIYTQAVLDGELAPTLNQGRVAEEEGDNAPWIKHVRVQHGILNPGEHPVYAGALKAILRAYDQPVGAAEGIASQVSDLTALMAGEYLYDPEAEAQDEHYLAAAREMIQKTITHLEAQQEADRQKLLAGVV